MKKIREQNENTYNRVSPIVRQFSLVFGLILFFGGFALLFLALYGRTNIEFRNIGMLLFFFGFIALMSIFGLNIIFQTISRNTLDLQKYYISLFAKLSNSFVNLIFLALFLTSLIYMLIILIQPEIVFTQPDEKIKFNAQVLVSVCLGGFLGGFVRETYSRILVSKDGLTNIFINNFWIIIFSLLGSVLLSIIFFYY